MDRFLIPRLGARYLWLLIENPACVTSAFGSQMVIPGEWKGMSTAQIEEIKKLNNYKKEQQMSSDT